MNFFMILLGILLLLWYAMPIFTKRILNIGNGTGLLLGTCLILLGCFFQPFFHRVQILFANKSTRIPLFVVASLLFIILFLAIICTIKILSALKKSPTTTGTVILLGCRVYGTKASLMLEERIFAAYDYLSTHPDASCICTGGKGADEEITEAACAYQYLLDLGIEKERLYMETLSTTTYENIKFAKEIMEKQKLTTPMLIVTNEFHEYRALKLAKHFGLFAYCLPAHTAWWLFPTYFTRELYAILFYFFTRKIH